MSLLEKVKSGAQQAASKSREELQEIQTKRELNQVYGELGQKLFEIAERGEAVHPELQGLVDRARETKARLSND